MSKFIKPKHYNVRVRLRSDHFANFSEFFHLGSADNDYFYKILKKICTDHALVVNDEELFKSPMTNEGFKFKLDPSIKCYSLSNRPCLIEDILDLDVMMKLKIYPYDFLAEDKRLIGVSVTALEIKAVKDLL